MSYPSFLAIKIKSLAEEARIIKKDEEKYQERARRGQEALERWAGNKEKEASCKNTAMDAERQAYLMYRHRTEDVRQEARSALLAYGFLQGKSYREMEPIAYWERHEFYRPKVGLNEPNWKRIEELITNYGTSVTFSTKGINSKERLQALLQRFAEWRDAIGKLDERGKKQPQPEKQYEWKVDKKEDGTYVISLLDVKTDKEYTHPPLKKSYWGNNNFTMAKRVLLQLWAEDCKATAE